MICSNYRQIRLFILFWTIAFFLLTVPKYTQALEPPPLHGRVNDHAKILSQATVKQLEEVLGNLEESDSTQIAVLTIPSLSGENLEEFSLRVAEKWQLGTADFDNGALLLIALKERKVRIEVGYGLEGSLTDLLSGRIIRHDIIPHFKKGNYDQGTASGVNAIIEVVRGEYRSPETASGNTPVKNNDPFGFFAILMFFLFFIGKILHRKKLASAIAGGLGAPLLGFFFLGFNLTLLLALIPVGIVLGLIFSKLSYSSGRSRRSGHIISDDFGSSSGGFGGFGGGGGGFGGGGASGDW